MKKRHGNHESQGAIGLPVSLEIAHYMSAADDSDQNTVFVPDPVMFPHPSRERPLPILYLIRGGIHLGGKDFDLGEPTPAD